MNGVFKIMNIRNIQVSVHWTFLLLLAWVIWVNVQAGYTIEELGWSVIFLLAVFACVLLHEMGHAFVARRFGIQAKDIVLLPIGGIASIEKFPDNPAQELAISIAGPLVNLAIALLLLPFLPAYVPFWKISYSAGGLDRHSLLYNLHVVNIWLLLFNLIPAFPMDGGRVLRALLGFKFNYIKATSIAAAIGKLVAVAFIATGILFFDLLLPFIGIFIIFSAGAEEYYLRLKDMVKGIKVKDVLMYDYNCLQANTLVKDAASILMNNHSKYFILMDGPSPAGTINRMEIVKAMAEKQYDQPLKALVKEEVHCLDGEKEVGDTLETLAANDERLYPVMENNHFAGVLNFSHIVEYLLLHKTETGEYRKVKSLSGLL